MINNLASNYDARNKKLQNLRLAETGDCSSDMPHMLNGNHLADPHFSVAAVYVGTIAVPLQSFVACHHNRLEIVEYLIRQAEYEIPGGKAINAAAAAGHTEVP